MLNNNPFVSI